MIITNVTGNVFLKENDTATEMHLAIQEVDGTAVDLSSATRLEVVIGTLEGRYLTKTPTLLDAPGELTFGLDEGDMLPVGDNLLEVYIYDAAGEKRVAPSKGHYKLRIQQSLGSLGLVVTTYTLDYFLSEVNRITYGLPELILRAETTANTLDEFLETTDQLHAETVETLGRANSAVETVNNAADRAETVITNADTATNNANTAATAANDAKTAADTATSKANTAASNADEKATLAQNAANVANTAKESADTATSAANTATQNANTAATAANNIKDELSGYNIPISDFVLATSYLKHQPVRDNGSTFRAKKATQGNPLPLAPLRENEWWTLEAQRGVDGDGAVGSVNNIFPDVDGNVTIDSTSIGGVAQEVFAAHANNNDIHVTKTDKSNWNAKYTKPALGIPLADLDSTITTSLGKADTALQSVTDASTTVKGVVQLNDTLTSTSTILATTANQAKVLKDLVDTKASSTDLTTLQTQVTTHLDESKKMIVFSRDAALSVLPDESRPLPYTNISKINNADFCEIDPATNKIKFKKGLYLVTSVAIFAANSVGMRNLELDGTYSRGLAASPVLPSVQSLACILKVDSDGYMPHHIVMQTSGAPLNLTALTTTVYKIGDV